MPSLSTGIQKRLFAILAAIFLVVLAGSTGYYIIFRGEPSFMDCLYMTVISLTTVGYGEVLKITGNIPAQIFSMTLIIFGMGVILYGISTLTALIVEGEVSGILRRKKMEKQINRLSNHYIVCGGGETGRYVLRELITNREQVVLVEQDEQRINLCEELGTILYVRGDSTEDDNLIAAGIKKAAGIIITLPHDKDNVYITMTARMLNPNIRIISRMVDTKMEPKLRNAGADGVVSPNFIGGLRMASEMIRPAAVHFLDKMLRSKEGDMRIHQITISSDSDFVGKTIKTARLKDKYNIMVLACQEQGKKDFLMNPPSSTPLSSGTTLMVMGDVKTIKEVRAIA